MKKILVTGADGFSALHLLPLLRETEKDWIAGTMLNKSPQEKWLDQVYYGDITEFGFLKKVVLETCPDQIYHLAAIVPIALVRSDFPRALRVNVEGTFHLLEAVSNGSPTARVLFIGSSEEYGIICPDELPLQEIDKFSPANEYGMTKVGQELLARIYQRGRNMLFLFTRTFNITGPGQSPEFVCSSIAMQVAKCRRQGGRSIRIGNLDVKRDFLDVRDAVRAYQIIMEKGISGMVFNVCSGEAVSLTSVLDTLRELAGVQISVERDDERFRKVDIPHIVGNNEKICRLGWRRSIPMRDTLRDLLSHWEKNLPEDIRKIERS